MKVMKATFEVANGIKFFTEKIGIFRMRPLLAILQK